MIASVDLPLEYKASTRIMRISSEASDSEEELSRKSTYNHSRVQLFAQAIATTLGARADVG